MKTEQTFKTKTGFCHILTDKIVLTRDGIIGNVAELTTGKSVYRILTIYGVLAIFMLYKSYQSMENQEWFWTIMFGGIGIYLVYNIIKGTFIY